VSWSHPQVSIDDLLYVSRTTMPPKAAGSIAPADHAAVVAFILHSNGYRPGTVALAAGSTAGQRFAWSANVPRAADAAPEFIAGSAGAVPASQGPGRAALERGGEPGDWLLPSRDYSGSRHSPLAQIDTRNVARLAPACIFQVGERDNFQTGPIVHDGTLYLTTWRSTFALDAASCRLKWKHTWEPRGSSMWERNRGAALKDGRVVRGTPDGYLIALAADRGTLLWARRVASPESGETFSMAPTIFDNLVLLGPAGSENNIQGWVGAFSLEDGSPVWRFNTIPRTGEFGYDTWRNPKNIPMGGGAVWTGFSLDPATGDLHLAVANPSPDLPVHTRLGDNLFTNSIVTLDVRTGKRRWHRSLVPNDSHDWDLTHAAPIFKVTAKGADRRVVATAGKDGVLRALDRDTHDILYETPITTRENAEAPVSITPARACPGVLGGVQWSGPSHHPGTNMLYVPAVDWCATFAAFEEPRFIPGKMYLGGTFELDPPQRARGWLTAVDAGTGAVKWKYESPRPMLAAVTTTAGNLVLTGELTGDFLAFDARTGDVLYRFNTGGAMGGGIVTYAVAGRQYIAAVSGSPSNFWPIQNPGAPTLVVFSLPNGPDSD
jgi:alcohol dehydrogenase (cytochrome c)